jgi:putative transposase
MKKPKQLKLFSEKVEREFGGSLNLGKRKQKRPLAPKLPAHFVLKANNHDLLLPHSVIVVAVVRKYSEKFGVKIFELGLETDHIHIEAQIPSRELYTRWIRTVPAMLARRIPGLKWSFTPYSRIVSWGRDFENTRAYVRDNQTEGEFIKHAHERMESWRRQTLADLGILG